MNTGKEIIEFLGGTASVYPDDAPGNHIGYFWGVPVSVLDKWAGKLTSSGWTVVVVSEVKNAAEKVSRREVSKVLSAGTHIESADPGKSHCLSALWLESAGEAPMFGVATVDLTTGQVFLYDGQATGTADCWHTDDLRHFFQVYPPKELLLYSRQLRSMPAEDELRRTLYVPTAPIHMKVNQESQQGTLESAPARETYLRELFCPKTALPLRTWLRVQADGSSLCERALVSLLRFTEDHVKQLAKQLHAPIRWHPKDNLQVINNTLTQLNLVGTPDQQCVADLFVSPVTAMGKRSLTARLCSPLADSAAIQERHAQVQWCLANLDRDLYSSLASIYDLQRLHRCILRGTVGPAEIVQLYQSYVATKFLSKSLESSPFAKDGVMESLISSLSALQDVFDISKAKTAMATPDELGILLTSSGPSSAEVEVKIKSIYEQANQWLTTLKTLCRVEDQAVYYKPTEKNMFSVHATKAGLKSVETGLKTLQTDAYKGLQCKTLTSAGRLEHKALDGFQESLDSATKQFQRIQRHEVAKACIQYASAVSEHWQGIEDWITHVDLTLSMAKTANKYGWVQPTILPSQNQPSEVHIQHLRHPLIEVQKRQSKYVTHDVTLDSKGQGWLLYGMNASGKSSLMKAIGLAVLLAQIGSFVPATSMTLRPFHKIATRILNQDNLWAGLSSFAVEMSELREILAVADHNTLVLGDELCAGTESISATAIVAAGIQHLHQANARFVLATHLHDLMKLEAIKTLESLKVWHLHVEYDPVRDLLVYHRTLEEGSGSSMYGLEVAKALHLPKAMIESALALRRELMGTSAEEDAKQSKWNPSLVRRKCSACDVAIDHTLEVHHLQERARASQGRNEDGTGLNHIRNLAVLCQSCHDKHHAGTLQVGPVEDTSEGPKRQIVDLSQFAHIPETKQVKTKTYGYSEEEIQKIKQTVQQYKALTPRLLVIQIREDHELELTEAKLKLLMKQGLV